MLDLFNMICRVHQEMPPGELQEDLENTLIAQFTEHSELIRSLLLYLDTCNSQASKNVRIDEIRQVIVDNYCL